MPSFFFLSEAGRVPMSTHNVVLVQQNSGDPNCLWRSHPCGKQLVAQTTIAIGEPIIVSLDNCIFQVQLAAGSRICWRRAFALILTALVAVFLMGVTQVPSTPPSPLVPTAHPQFAQELTAQPPFTQAATMHPQFAQALTAQPPFTKAATMHPIFAQELTAQPPFTKAATMHPIFAQELTTKSPITELSWTIPPSTRPSQTQRWVTADGARADFEASKAAVTGEIGRFATFVFQRSEVPQNYSVADCSYMEPFTSLFSSVSNFVAGGKVIGLVASEQPIGSSMIEHPRDVADSFVWTFSKPLPHVVKDPPVSFADRYIGLNISQPFGAWGTAFFNISDITRDAERSTFPVVGGYPQVEDPAPPLYAVVTRNAYVAKSHLHTCDGHILYPGGFGSDTHYVDLGSLFAESQQTFDVVIPFCADLCSGNYYHFLHEQLPRITLVHDILTRVSSQTVRLVLPKAPNRYMRFYLFDVLGIPNDRVIWDESVIGRQVVYPMAQRTFNTAVGLVGLLRNLVLGRLAMTTTVKNYTRLLLVFSEREKFTRMPRNYRALKAKVMLDFADQLRFETVTKASVPAQISAFHRADIVVGPHGANLANMIWMRKGAHLVEIMSHKGDPLGHLNGNMCYYNAASRVGVHHHLLLHPTGKRDFFTVSYDEFKAHIEHAINGLRGSSNKSN